MSPPEQFTSAGLPPHMHLLLEVVDGDNPDMLTVADTDSTAGDTLQLDADRMEEHDASEQVDDLLQAEEDIVVDMIPDYAVVELRTHWVGDTDVMEEELSPEVVQAVAATEEDNGIQNSL